MSNVYSVNKIKSPNLDDFTVFYLRLAKNL